jgi:hypothetical protein
MRNSKKNMYLKMFSGSRSFKRNGVIIISGIELFCDIRCTIQMTDHIRYGLLVNIYSFNNYHVNEDEQCYHLSLCKADS